MSGATESCWRTWSKAKSSRKTPQQNGNAETADMSKKATKHPKNVPSAHMREATSKSGPKTTEHPCAREVREMTEVGQIYSCEMCGNKVRVLGKRSKGTLLLQKTHETRRGIASHKKTTSDVYENPHSFLP